MSWRKLEKSIATFRQLRICGAVLTALVLVLTSKSVYAEPSWCVKELKRGDDNVIVSHNPDCDLRTLARRYPQKDADGNVLPMQVQLRSLYAANQTRVEDGVKRRYTVMRGCVRPGKPSEHADDEERELCPDGLMNYFSAPASDRAARIVVPVKRHLTRAEHNLALAKAVCCRLQNKVLRGDADKAVAKECKEEFPEMVFGAAEEIRPDAEPVKEAESATLSGLRKKNQELSAKLATVVPAAEKAKYIWPLFVVLIGLAVFGAGSSVALLRDNRKRRELERKHKFYVRGVNSTREQWQKQIEQKYSGIAEELAYKLNSLERQKQHIRQEARQSAAFEVGAEFKRLEAENFQLAEANRELQDRINDLRTSIMPPPGEPNETTSAEAEQLRVIDEQAAEVRSLREDIVDKNKQINELRGELQALTGYNLTLEESAKQAAVRVAADWEGTVAKLQSDIAAYNIQVSSLKRQVAFLRETLTGKECELEMARAGRSSEEEVDRLYAYVATPGESSMLKKTLSQGLFATQSAQNAEDKEMPTEEIRKGDEIAGAEFDLEREDSLQSVNPEDSMQFPLHRDPDDYAAIPTLTPADAATFEQAEIKRPTMSWSEVARLFAYKLLPGYEIKVDSDPADAYKQLEDALQELLGGYAKVRDELASAEQEKKVHLEGREKNADCIRKLEEKLRAARVELKRDQESADCLRRENIRMAGLLREDKPLEKLYAYQLAATEAESRALQAEKMRLRLSEEVERLKHDLTNKNDVFLNAEADEQQNSFFQRAQSAMPLIGLDRGDLQMARQVLSEMPRDALLLLTGSVFAVIADKIKAGEHPELPVSCLEDLYALHDLGYLPIVSMYGFTIPESMRKVAGGGDLKLIHTLHDAFSRPEIDSGDSESPLTVRPETAVPEDRNSSVPAIPSTNESVVRQRAVICPPADLSDDDKSQSAS